jgi:glycopeptide antibiotics resistance protein
MRRDYEGQRKVIALTFALFQVNTFATALVVGTMAWNFLSVIRVVIFALLVSMLVTNSRRWDWVVVLAIMTALIIRLNLQVVR